MSKLKNLITTMTRDTFAEVPVDSPLADLIGQRKQISLRPNMITLTKIDVLADILDVSRQSLVDDLLDQGIDDAVDAYCEAHGPDHEDAAKDSFRKEFLRRAVGHDGSVRVSE